MRQFVGFATRLSLRRVLESITREHNTTLRSREANHCHQFLAGTSRVQHQMCQFQSFLPPPQGTPRLGGVCLQTQALLFHCHYQHLLRQRCRWTPLRVFSLKMMMSLKHSVCLVIINSQAQLHTTNTFHVDMR